MLSHFARALLDAASAEPHAGCTPPPPRRIASAAARRSVAEAWLRADGELTSLLLSLSPAAIDAEIRMLSGESAEQMRAVLQFVLSALESNAHFEILQAVLSVLLNARRRRRRRRRRRTVRCGVLPSTAERRQSQWQPGLC